MKSKPIYNPKALEQKWQQYWLENQTYQPALAQATKPFYNLMMFPYPSAEGLHVGNMYAFTGADVYGRFQRMQGNEVFEPIGLDGFGIHSENYAIKIGKHPAEQAKVSQKRFYEQLSQIGDGFAWESRLETYDPKYYRWTQWLFVQMYKRGLAYRKAAVVNWCPSCKTVLADEQVEAGVCERCKTPVQRRQMEQWFFKITNYAERLLANLEHINWPAKIKLAQRNWIGKSEGTEIRWQVEGTNEVLQTFTTRLDTIYGVTFLVIAPDHPLLLKLAITTTAQQYRQAALKKTEQQRKTDQKDKTGADTGVRVIHPLTGRSIPVWVADFVLIDYGTGVVMGVPAHDQRDWEFAKKFDLEVIPVITNTSATQTNTRQVMVEDGLLINSAEFNGIESTRARQKILEVLEKRAIAEKKVTYHLRDWLISRQRYWGPPIPMVYCDKCGWQPVPEEQLPVLLPDVKDYQPTGDGKSPLQRAPQSWLTAVCPNCGGEARRETDVSDTFLDSAWYFLAYPNLHTVEWTTGPTPFNDTLTRKWLPVNAYIGGAEHAVLHLLYSRFVWMALRDWGYLPDEVGEEPFPFLFSHGLIIKDGVKMSKSRGNVINPDEYISRYGADTLRMYLMFLGPYDQGGDFRDSGIAGMYRFLERIWKAFREQISDQESLGEAIKTTPALRATVHQTIKRVTRDMGKFKYNTAIAALMEFMNAWEEKREQPQQLSREDAVSFLKLLSPLAPHIAEELYHQVFPDTQESIHQQGWPDYEESLLVRTTLDLPVQVNGKTRAVVKIESSLVHSEEEVAKRVLAHPNVAKYVAGRSDVRRIFVPGKTINFIIG